jgi:phosphoglycolate phosphatase-like HAD superfamily hydrolase
MNLSSAEAILWDFDGVLMNSNPVRDKGFELVLADYPAEQVEALMKYHRRNGGLSRYVKFRYFFETVLGQPVTEEQVQALARSFSEIMLQSLLDPSLLIEESMNFIKRNHHKIDMHIVSGSDGKELNMICDHLGLAGFFKTISGSPTPKVELVKKIVGTANYRNVVLIGDSINDFDAAAANHIEFLGYNNPALTGIGAGYINSFAVYD